MAKHKKTVKNPHAVALGHLGGLKGGPARARKLSSIQRSAIAKKGAKATNHKKQVAHGKGGKKS